MCISPDSPPVNTTQDDIDTISEPAEKNFASLKPTPKIEKAVMNLWKHNKSSFHYFPKKNHLNQRHRHYEHRKQHHSHGRYCTQPTTSQDPHKTTSNNEHTVGTTNLILV